MNIIWTITTTIIIGLAALFITSCGGGGGSDTAAAPPTWTTPRGDLLFGYFGDNDGMVADTKDHVNVILAWGWGVGPDPGLQHALEAVQAGKKIILPVWWQGGPDGIRYYFTKMRNANVLGRVVALYPQDEPDVNSMSDAEVKAMVDLVRSIANEYVELQNVPIAAIYGTKGNAGIQYFDWIGQDNYPGVPQVALLPHQSMILCPGGANPWRTDPMTAVNIAETNLRVAIIIPFIWRYPQSSQGLGIESNGMAPAYRAAGKLVTGQ